MDGDSGKSVLDKMAEDVAAAQKGLDMRKALLEELFTSIEGSQWRDAFNVSFPRPKTSAMSFNVEESLTIDDRLCVSVLVDNHTKVPYSLMVTTNPPSSTTWIILDGEENQTAVIEPTTSSSYRLLLSFPRSLFYSTEDYMSLIVVHTRACTEPGDRLLHEAFPTGFEPPKDTAVLGVEPADVQPFTLETLRRMADDGEVQKALRMLQMFRLVRPHRIVPPIDQWTFVEKESEIVERVDYGGGLSILFGRGIYSDLMITTKSTDSMELVLQRVYCRTHEELRRCEQWLKKGFPNEWKEWEKEEE